MAVRKIINGKLVELKDKEIWHATACASCFFNLPEGGCLVEDVTCLDVGNEDKSWQLVEDELRRFVDAPEFMNDIIDRQKHVAHLITVIDSTIAVIDSVVADPTRVEISGETYLAVKDADDATCQKCVAEGAADLCSALCELRLCDDHYWVRDKNTEE